MNSPAFTFRPIRPEDDAPEFGADGPGFAIHDAEVSAMSVAYGAPRAAYFVVEVNGRVVGGAGIAPLQGADEGTAELRKMYFLPEVRGIGAGSALLRHILSVAKNLGFARVYLETLTGMDAAQRLYEYLGFRRIDKQLGATGHFACNRFYLLELGSDDSAQK
jgi:putative acetyltransferase